MTYIYMTGYIPDVITGAARELRKNMTASEEQLRMQIRNKKLGYKFLRQKPLYLYTEITGQDRYIIPDFYCIVLKLIIEVDGSIHYKNEIISLDKEKELLLQEKGFRVLRFTNQEINSRLDRALKQIEKTFP
ncbi:MAG: DUF559 domain-containing protein [Candidatus Gracilibacteria bacterium]|nr:DUF559 domain-containing protein [Candidatus Gracilibacteria bacterium]